MNYCNLYNFIKTQQCTQVLGDEIIPIGLVLYQLPKGKSRANIKTLGLTNDHKARSASIHVFESVILVNKAYSSAIFPSSTLYCAWLESDPHYVIFWERHAINGITKKINRDRFIKRFKYLDGNGENENDHLEIQSAQFAKLMQTNFLNSISGGNKGNLLVPTDFTPSFSSDNDNNWTCPEYRAASEPSLRKIHKEELAFSMDNEAVVSGTASNKLSEDFFADVNETKSRKSIIERYLFDDDFNHDPLLDDDEFDPSGAMTVLRTIFDVVCPLGDAMIAARLNRWHNMNKTILNEFKAVWEQAITTVRDTQADGFLVDAEWIEAMWLHAVGCPKSVRTKLDMLSVIRGTFLTLKDFERYTIITALKREGFRTCLAQFISDRCCFDTFKQDIIDIATQISFNSYLCSVDDSVHFTHLHEVDDVFIAVDPPTKLTLNYSDGRAAHQVVTPLELEMGDLNWTPRDFAESTFYKLKSIFDDNSVLYILGHACPEQSVVGMGKNGMSPFATYRNEMSCGHGMYFFRLDSSVFELSFEDLNEMALNNSPVHDPRGLQFRAFVNALHTVFQKKDCDALSPCLLVFLLNADLQPFDAVKDRLPMCNDDVDTGWKCKCAPLFSIIDQKVMIDERWKITPSAVCNAISILDETDVEKLNSFALLGGVVDFERISSGLYTAIIMDNNAQEVTSSLRNMKSWSMEEKYNIWEELVKKRWTTFRRPITMFNSSGGFSQLQPLQSDGKGKEQWNMCPFDPILETVFVSNAALDMLLLSASKVCVVFLSPDDEISKRGASCHEVDSSVNATPYSHILAASCVERGPDNRHRYWKNRINCASQENLVGK